LLMAKELGVNVRTTSGPVLERPGDLVGLLTSLQPNDILFIDEVHRLRPALEEFLYPAMEDYRVDVRIADGPHAQTIPMAIEQFDGGPVGLTTIAAAVGEDAGTLEEVYEPFLMQQGFLARTPRGRCATAGAYKHFGFTPPRSAEQPTMFDS